MSFYVYILASARNGTLYIGQTDNLVKRIYEHQNHMFPNAFTAKYNVMMLVYYDVCITREEAKLREKKLKKFTRQQKLKLIEAKNPHWNDLSTAIRS